jgi:hypothetical protein
MKSDRCCFCLTMNRFFLGIALVVMALANGCSLFSNIKDVKIPFKAEASPLKMKVGMARVQNISDIKDKALAKNLETLVMEELTEKCSQGIFLLSGTSEMLGFLENPEKRASGDRNSLYLAGEGRRVGLNSIVFITLTGIHREEGQKRFIWFKNNRSSVKLDVRIEAFDPYTGAKMLYENLVKELSIGPDEIIQYKEGKVSEIPSIKDGIGKISKTIGETLCDTLREVSWKGFIVHSGDDGVEISSGSEVGIHVGDKFVVYENQGTVAGMEGDQYRILGRPIDEITITAVSSDSAKGISTSGKAVPKGSFIQAKKK